MGDEQRLSPDEQLAFAREAFESGTDFTLAVEEEFALLDPETLELTNRFEEVRDAAVGTELEEHLVGELIASEVEIKTGRCDTFAEASRALGERRVQLDELAARVGVGLAATGTHPWSRWQDQRIIDTPHYRRNDELLRYVVWRNNTFGLHVHVGIRGADRAVAVTNALRNVLPELLALSASSPFVEDVVSGLHSARTEIFTKMFPRCGIPDVYEGWAGFEDYVTFLYRTASITEHTQLWWSVRPHLNFPTVEIRICDAQPELGDAQALSALAYALTARYADIWNAGGQTPDGFREYNAILDGYLVKEGRPASAVRRTLRMNGFTYRNDAELAPRLDWYRRNRPVGEGLSNAEMVAAMQARDAAWIVGSPDQVAAKLRALGEAGVEEVTWQWFDPDDVEGLKLISDEVIPLLK